MNICVYGAASDIIDSSFIRSAECLGEEIAKRGHNLVFGGGAKGVMGGVARGVFKNGGKITGVAPSFFNVDGVLFENCTDLIRTETMRQRKQIMEDKSDAFIVCPGGIGTFEEFFEILTLKQLLRHNKPIAILNTNGYYDKTEDVLNNAAELDFMPEGSKSLYKFFKDINLLLDYVENYRAEEQNIENLRHISK